MENVEEGRARREDATASRVRIERPERPGVHVVAENRGPSVVPVPGSSSSPGAIAVRLDSLCPKEQHRRDINAGVHDAVATGAGARIDVGAGAGVGDAGVGDAGVVIVVVCGVDEGTRVDIRRVHQNKTREFHVSAVGSQMPPVSRPKHAFIFFCTPETRSLAIGWPEFSSH